MAALARQSAPVPWVKQAGRPPQTTSTSELRDCRRHGTVEFHRYRAGRGKYRWRCKRCIGEHVTRRHQKLRRILVDEAGGCCAVCGYQRCIINLHFHHIDPSTKAFSMSMARGKSIASYRAEAEKCVLVCANCHGEIEAGQIPSPPAQARFKPPS
jgi:hypothetical protein